MYSYGSHIVDFNMPRCHLSHIHTHMPVCIHNMYRVATEGAGIK